MVDRMLTFVVAMLGFLAGPALAAAADFRTLDQAEAWLERQATEMIHQCRRSMDDGTAAFPPQVGGGYNAFWLRDYAYMLEGCAQTASYGFSDEELRRACLLFVRAQRDDGACVDCVKFDGTPIYKPGYGRMGKQPVTDGSQFTVDVAWHTHRRLQDREFLQSIVDRLIKGMNAVPRNPETRLVHIVPAAEQERCPYGFTDTVQKQGEVLFSSLLFVQASRQLADLLTAVDRPQDARHWADEAHKVSASINRVFWNGQPGLYNAATIKCKQPDIWGSAFAVYLDVANPQQAHQIAHYFQKHYGEIVERGQIRHLPGGVYWEAAGQRDQYQNGAYWATPTGWFVYTLDRVDPELADQTVVDMANDLRARGVAEWCFDETLGVGNYMTSVTLPLAGVRKMLQRRVSDN